MLHHVIAMGAGREPADLLQTIHLPIPSLESLRIPAQFKKVRAINVIPGQILTRQHILEATTREGYVVADPTRDLLKLAVVERHRGTGNIGLGLVMGFGLRAGALASSVAHDSHNLIAVGIDDGDVLCALREVSRLGGVLAVCAGGRVLSSLALPIAGLMTHAPLAQVTEAFEALHQGAKTLGCALTRPFMALSFLALPVIPELRLTDRGLVDVERACFVPLHAA